GAADGWEHFIHHPLLEALGRGEVTSEDQAVEVALRDERHLLHTAVSGDVAFRDTLAMLGERGPRVGVPKRSRHVGADEPRIAALVDDDPDLVPVENALDGVVDLGG